MDKITIPDKHYVGLRRCGNSAVPSATMTPWGTDAAATRRMQTVKQFAGSHSDSIPTLVIDNIPMSGFRLPNRIAQGHGCVGDAWTILDPRGFEMEITASNFAELLSVTSIERGEIQEPCMWARSGGSNVLLSIESTAYQDAVKLTAISQSKAKWRDAKRGYKIILQNGTTGTYLGKMHLICSDYRTCALDSPQRYYVLDRTMHVIHAITPPTSYGSYKTQLMLVSAPKLAQIAELNEIGDQEADQMANECIQDPTCLVQISLGSSVHALSSNPIIGHKVRLEHTEDDGVLARKAIKLKNGDIGLPVRWQQANKLKIINQNQMAEGNLIFETTNTRPRRSDLCLIDYQTNDIDSVYDLMLDVHTSAGITISTHLDA